MSIRVIFGKPGSGKSYHAVKFLADMLCDWARNEKKTGERHPQVLRTNLPLNRDAVKEYVDKQVTGIDFDVDYYVENLNDDFFTPPTPKCDQNGAYVYDKKGDQEYVYWWDKFADDSLIVLDEMHRYLGSEYQYVNTIEETAALRNYMAQHRHHRHDWVLITQDVSQIARPVLKMAEQAVEVFNAKSTTLPFPISIPLSDVETLLKGFGVNRQLYRVRTGTFWGYRIRYDGVTEAFVMSSEIFALYTSNTLANEKSGIVGDRALPFTTRTGAVLWFAKKHVPHLAVKAGVCVFLFLFAKDVIFNLPTIFTSNLAKTSSKATSSFLDDKKALQPTENIGVPNGAAPIKINEPTQEITEENPKEGTPIYSPSNVGVDFAIRAFFIDRVIAGDGTTYRIGEKIEIGKSDGTPILETLEQVAIKRREVKFESGRIWSRKGFDPPVNSTENDDAQDVVSADVSDNADNNELQGAFLSPGSESESADVREDGTETNESRPSGAGK